MSGFHREMTDGSLRPHQTTADRSVTINRGLTCRRGRQTNTTLLIPAEILSLSAPSSESKGAGSVRDAAACHAQGHLSYETQSLLFWHICCWVYLTSS